MVRFCGVAARAGQALRSLHPVGGAALLAVLLLAGGMPAQAAGPAAAPAASVAVKPVIGVIDLQQILAKADAARKVASQRESYLNAYQARVAEQEKGLRDIDQKLGQERATLDQATFNKRREEFQSKVAAFQKEVEIRRRNLERAYTQAMNEIQGAVIRHTKDLATARGMNIVVYRSQVFLFDPEMDITDEVLAAVNASLPSVSMPNPDSLPPTKETK
ncbi:OmpH family outer membrane protein [Insolitispirillum peregrinum]|uniref:Periplasmic chaperone for outer membrane proteins Skp n=1 Tax=Insolitispirillum peregrinum TaxID=80876 RepID=A0A1N7NUM1_9PROT|nr:OmpH family outer membrane protein [Insolitispirillum peregrinum]SIT02010.1 periplasmic chaperone for outer membrane proteins Skp [Insolitispirillum peregrinum]